VDELGAFLHTEAKLPAIEKKYQLVEPIKISVEQSREQIIDCLQQMRRSNSTADLAFYAYRDMESCEWEPFIKAAVERNPVSIRMADAMSLEEVYSRFKQMRNNSIYDGKRLAQPDEVANYKTGDGVEKAFLLANVIRQRNPEQEIEITVDNSNVVLKGQNEYCFVSEKGFKKKINIP